MTRDELIISEAKKYYSGNIQCYDAFLHGVEFAEEHPINEWHTAEEEPQGDEWEVLCDADDCYLTTDPWTLAWKVGQSWEKYVRVNSVKRWLYLSDLFPKGE